MHGSAVILCGGKSERMGADKASLPFGEGATLLSAVVYRVAQGLEEGPIVCVAAAGQELPPLPPRVRILHDRQPDPGPLEALAVGLRAVEREADVTFVCGCDAPLLEPRLVEAMLAEAACYNAAVPVVEGFRQSLLAAYQTSVAQVAEELLAAGERSLHALLDRLKVTEIEEPALRQLDPELRSLLNCNDRESYERALGLAD